MESKEEPAILGQIMDTALLELRDRSWMVAVPVDEGCAREMLATLREALSAISAVRNVPVRDLLYEGRPADHAVGVEQARAMSHPAIGMIVAEVLFDSAIEPLAEWGAEVHGLTSLMVARVLHHVVWRRFPAGAVGYAAGLRRHLFEVERDSRRKLSRELHDRIAHGIAAARQRIELGAQAADGRVPGPVADAMSILTAVMEDVRDMATELRSQVGDRTLNEALETYVGRSEGSGLPIKITHSGTPRLLSRATSEELYLISLEAIRNARAHAATATVVDVGIHWDLEKVRLEISDDGQGFDTSAPMRPDCVGLHSMKERAGLFGADLSITSQRGNGTRVVVSVLESGQPSA
ncbi:MULTISPECIES: ATP-binding protein [unclassified Leifsonia]|uniref:sensor histidine kinase n=1 Tax=unclassified Leifsonia TaxID=2663824 RepID=UPI000B7DDCAF|nr:MULTISPECIES: ATP-binding protein [unclassified Leifsonia]